MMLDLDAGENEDVVLWHCAERHCEVPVCVHAIGRVPSVAPDGDGVRAAGLLPRGGTDSDSHSGVAVWQDAAGQAGQRLDVGEVLRLKGLFLALANLSLRITGNQLDAVEFRFPVLHTHANAHMQPWTQTSARIRGSCTLDRPLRSNVRSIHRAPPQGGHCVLEKYSAFLHLTHRVACGCVCGGGWQRPADRPVAACWGAADRERWGHDSGRQKSSYAPSAEAQGSRGRRCGGGGADRAARCRGCFRSCGRLRAGARFLSFYFILLWSSGGLGHAFLLDECQKRLINVKK